MGGLVLAYNDYTEITGILIFSYRKADFKLWKEEYLRNLKSDHVYSRPWVREQVHQELIYSETFQHCLVRDEERGF